MLWVTSLYPMIHNELLYSLIKENYWVATSFLPVMSDIILFRSYFENNLKGKTVYNV